MPAASKSASTSRRQKPPVLDNPSDPDIALEEQESSLRPSRKKNRHAASRLQHNAVVEKVSRDESNIADEESPSPERPPSDDAELPHAVQPTRRSPLIDVLGDDSPAGKVLDEHTPPTDAWVHNVTYGRSPPGWNGLSVAGSPPVQADLLGRGGFNSNTPPVSPPQRKARPISYGSTMPRPQIPHRASISPYGYSPSTYGSPPAPHLAQQHFYGAYDVDIGIGRGVPPEEQDSTLSKFVFASGAQKDQPQMVINGYEGLISVLSVKGDKWSPVGSLQGLNGTVVDAAFLTWDHGIDPFAQMRPLMAVVIHGPALREDNVEDGQGNRGRSTSGHEYQTKVEVHSLAHQTFVSELLRCPPAHATPAVRGRVTAPEPVGHLRLHTSGNYIAISSAASGEVYTFGISIAGECPTFECLGKFWTSIQPRIERRESTYAQSSDADSVSRDRRRTTRSSDAAMLDLSGRWLAICPPGAASRPPLGAILGEGVILRAMSGIESGSAPTRPVVNCEVDSPDADNFLSKVAKGAAQELVKGARWLGDQGYQAWQSYWKKDSASPAPSSRMYSPPAQPVTAQFPPTHAEDLQSQLKEAQLVTILDLRSLQAAQTAETAGVLGKSTTFLPPRGCSFLSFSPNGLRLLTASRKGDVHYVWDLMQIRYARARLMMTEGSARSTPRVRQIARYERLSPSTIIDTVWDGPAGARFAVMTKNRTVHIYDLPLSASKWPPPRNFRKPRPPSAPTKNTDIAARHDAVPAGGFFASAMSFAGKTQPMLANLRGRAPSTGGFSGIGTAGIGFASATGVMGSRAVAAGLSKSLGAATETVSNIRHAGETRIHLKSLANEPLAGRLSWTWLGRTSALSIIDAHNVKTYYVRRSKPKDNRSEQSMSVFDARRAAISKMPITPTFHANAPTGAQGFWKPKSASSPASNQLLHPLSFAEIETNAPFQPFHSDPRVTLSIILDGAQLESELPTASMLGPKSKQKSKVEKSQWVFGDEISTVKLYTSTARRDRDDQAGSVVYRETKVAPEGEHGMEQIVSTTRRRKKNLAVGPNEDEDMQEGFFEDDCDVLDFAEDRV